MSAKKPPSTALTAIDGILPEPIARRMYEWRRVFTGPPPMIYLSRLGRNITLIETLDGKPLGDRCSYLAVETLTGHIVGTVRDGALLMRPDAALSARTRCTLFPAAKA